MTLEDVRPAAAAILADDFGDRDAWFRFAVAHERCDVLVAEVDGSIVGTGVVTHNGPAAWIGTIWVATSWRGRGLGRRLTEATMDLATAGGARTQILVATDLGRPVYERLGFRVVAWYRTVEAGGRGATPEASPSGPGSRPAAAPRPIRPYRPGDLDAMAALDRAATGEDRAHLLRAFADPESTRVVVDAADRPTGFLLRPPWGGGATIAPDPADAMALLDARRAAYPADRRVRAGVLDMDRDGFERLVAAGWSEAWRAPRLERGEPLDWQPGSIWGQFNHALG